MNIKQYIQNTQYLVIAGFINQKNFKYEFLNRNTSLIMMYSRTTTNNIDLVINMYTQQSMQHGYHLEFIIYKWNETKNENSKVNSLQCFSRDKKSFDCHSKVILL